MGAQQCASLCSPLRRGERASVVLFQWLVHLGTLFLRILSLLVVGVKPGRLRHGWWLLRLWPAFADGGVTWLVLDSFAVVTLCSTMDMAHGTWSIFGSQGALFVMGWGRIDGTSRDVETSIHWMRGESYAPSPSLICYHSNFSHTLIITYKRGVICDKKTKFILYKTNFRKIFSI